MGGTDGLLVAGAVQRRRSPGPNAWQGDIAVPKGLAHAQGRPAAGRPAKFDHCLGDLLYRYRIGELNMEVVAIISNHPREAMTTSLMGTIPFHYFPITKDSKTEQEARIKAVVNETGAELVVLARYMQILSDDLAACQPARDLDPRSASKIDPAARVIERV